MADFLLVHGAWHGAWCWRAVAPALVRAGHRVHAVTLTGLGERSHLLHAGIDLQTHITDVVQAMQGLASRAKNAGLSPEEAIALARENTLSARP